MQNTQSTPVTVFRENYRCSDWAIDRTRLHFILHPQATRVISELSLRWQSDTSPTQRPLTLDGVDLHLESLEMDGQLLDTSRYEQMPHCLTVHDMPEACVLRIVTVINPESNTALEGLYLSSGNFCTQCEAEGFRKITYYLDRPDVLSVFDVTIEAELAHYPVLLSNGNQLSAEPADRGWHLVKWHDPHPKPCYLFALVAGDLSVIEDRFVTASGQNVLLQIYVQEHNVAKCDFAMRSLKAAMSWDESVYGFEYDLDRFMIVAVDDFNMGAMENKGLNIFNSRFVLADQTTATDKDFLGVEAVIAHEYFHNWTGNRITCRDWFQLSLKEGLTVFRDQCFSSDRHSATVKRIEDVRLLRDRQYPEDAGPMAHPIRPDSYMEINNFYTLTVYEKGAEVIRMLHTLLGADAWREGMDTYVLRHDGSATTCDAFIDAMQSVTELDLTQFRRWYGTAGTPLLSVEEHYDEIAQRYELTISQSIPDTPGQTNKAPLHIPLVMGLLDGDGNPILVEQFRPANDLAQGSFIVDVTKASQTLKFDNVKSRPVASLLRGFSAPVRLQQHTDDQTLAFLMAHDSDAFNRWDASQRLSERIILSALETTTESRVVDVSLLVDAVGEMLQDQNLEASFMAEVLEAPSLDSLAELLDEVDFKALDSARSDVQKAIAEKHRQRLESRVMTSRTSTSAVSDSEAMGIRKLANAALNLLSYLPESNWQQLAASQFEKADNMTDRLAALACLCHADHPERDKALSQFHNDAKHDRLVLDKWFAVQASARRPTIIDDVLGLRQHPDFDLGNPNRIRALIANFAMNNPTGFHSEDGRGYQFLSDQIIELDRMNPQVAARLVTPLTQWRRLIPLQRLKMQDALKRIKSCDPLSPDVYELVTKSLL